MSNVLYCGDNFEVLAEYVPSESVDLIYLDPPFNSKRTYNVVYKDSHAQEEAFKDYWSWQEAAAFYAELVSGTEIPRRVRGILKSLHDLLIDDDSDLLAYLTMMAPRLTALHRALKPTGALYLHCDSTASHYLKLVLDAIFGTRSFKNNITWKRTVPKSDFRQGATNWPRVHDDLLYYVKDETRAQFKQPMAPYSSESLKKYSQVDKDGRQYQLTSLIAPGAGTRGHPKYEFMGVTRYWRYGKDKMEALLSQGRIIKPPKGTVPRYVRYLDEMGGVPVGDTWDDIVPINSMAKERTIYPTQKPVALLERIIEASSNPGDVVLDPFCGCGTTIVASYKLNRQWIGIDIARKAVDVLEERFAQLELPAPSVIWHPADADAAVALADRDKDQFEQWVRRKLRAEKRRRDRGIDGESYYNHEGRSLHVIYSVKGGRILNPAMVRELRGTIEREHADIGVLVCTHEPSKEMRLEATRAQFLPLSDGFGPIPRIQIVTVHQIFQERRPVRVVGENTYQPMPTIPRKGQTAMLFPVAKPKKVRGATMSRVIVSR